MRPLPISTNKLDIMVYAYNPGYVGGIGRRIIVRPAWTKT
jgi:hypothetical protein